MITSITLPEPLQKKPAVRRSRKNGSKRHKTRKVLPPQFTMDFQMHAMAAEPSWGANGRPRPLRTASSQTPHSADAYIIRVGGKRVLDHRICDKDPEGDMINGYSDRI